jgi:hypothetical protein
VTSKARTTLVGGIVVGIVSASCLTPIVVIFDYLLITKSFEGSLAQAPLRSVCIDGVFVFLATAVTWRVTWRSVIRLASPCPHVHVGGYYGPRFTVCRVVTVSGLD